MNSNRILLLEDDKTMLPLLGRLLSLDGFEPIFPNELAQIPIVEQIKNEKPNAIFMDVHLGDIDTMELVGQIKSDYRDHPPKILMASGMEMASDCLNAGADGFLMKPFNPEELLKWFHENCPKEES
jgi:DNA-binding response OmpR family regulator